MGLTLTIIAASLMLGLTVFCGWRGARPANKLFRPRLIPWRLLMVLAFMAWVAIMAHLVALLGHAGG